MQPIVVIQVSYPINLYIHLEVASGSIPIYHSSNYEKYVISTIPKFLKGKFLLLDFNEESSLALKDILCEFATLKNVFSKAERIPRRVDTVLDEANELYYAFWIKEARPKLLHFKRQLEQELPLLTAIPNEITEITGKPWKIGKIMIFPIYAYSENFGYGGQPIGKSKITIGLTNLEFSLVAITHEMAHLNIGKTVVNIAKWFNCEPDVIDEVIANLITETFIKKGRITFPEDEVPKGPETEEYKQFQVKLEKFTHEFRREWYSFVDDKGKYPNLEKFVAQVLAKSCEDKSLD